MTKTYLLKTGTSATFEFFLI